MRQSPSGKQVVENEGPKDAELILVGESPADEELKQGRPFVGRAGKLLDDTLRAAGVDRASCRIVNLVKCQAPANKFAAHSPADISWGKSELEAELQTLPNAKVIVALGANPLEWLTGLKGISDWRGSILDVASLQRALPLDKEDYLALADSEPFVALRSEQAVVPTYHPAAVLRQYDWHSYLINDLRRAARVVRSGKPQLPRRAWHFDDLAAVNELAMLLNGDPTQHAGVLSIDTEQNEGRYIVGLATDTDVYVFRWEAKYDAPLRAILASPQAIKVAHNLNHDWTFFKKRLDMDIALPWFDTMGGSHVLNQALEKSLSPGIATRFTDWAYHKWLGKYDEMLYNGMDCIVAYDAYEPMIDALVDSGLYEVAKHDHKLLEPLLDMQWRGFLINEQARGDAAEQLGKDRDALTQELQLDVAPIVDAKLKRFEKPQLFMRERSCECCGGGKTARSYCWRCGGLAKKPERKSDYCELPGYDEAATVKELRESLPVCRTCKGSGKVTERLAFNPNSSDQKADILYRGLSIPARRYKGEETTRVGQLEGIADKHPVVGKLVRFARVDADYDTVRRLRPGNDGALHCVLDPFGTDSGRVSSKEGLIEKGTNAMNIPKAHRKIVVPRPGYIFMYPDMEQVEARAIVAQTQDATLLKLFNDPKTDMHTLVRDDMRAIGLTGFSRDQAKRLEYASFYGARAAQLSKELTDEAYRKREGMPMDVEQTEMAMRHLLSHRFTPIEQWHKDIEQQLLANRYVQSLTGRRRYWLGYLYDPRTSGVQYETLKEAWSFVPQDIGAWVLGDGLLELYANYWDEQKHGLIHVHDALLYEVHESIADEAAKMLQQTLTRVLWGMRFPAKVKIGKNWYEAS